MASIGLRILLLLPLALAGTQQFNSSSDCMSALQSHAAKTMAPRPKPPAGLGNGGNAAPLRNETNVEIDEETLACADPKYQAKNGIWDFSQIAAAFLKYGAAKFYNLHSQEGPDLLTSCVGALTIVSGECQPTATSLGKGCSSKDSGKSGVFQLDFLRTADIGEKVNPQITKDGGIMNLCISGFGAGFLTATPRLGSDYPVATLEGRNYFTCSSAPPPANKYNSRRPDPQSHSGYTSSNFIGPFCHKVYLARYSPCNAVVFGSGGISILCCAGSGGIFWKQCANNSQKYPFPDYYYQKADQQEQHGANFKEICKEAIDDM